MSKRAQDVWERESEETYCTIGNSDEDAGSWWIDNNI